MKSFEVYPEIIGKVGIIGIQQNGVAVFISADKLGQFYHRIHKDLAEQIAEQVSKYNPFTHYLRLQGEQIGPVLYLVSQTSAVNSLDIEAVLKSPELAHPERTMLWFKALASAEAGGLLTLAQKLSAFKLRKNEYQILEPYILDFIVESTIA
jgi:hypothetical protein